MNLDHFSHNGVVVTLPEDNLKELINNTTYHEKESVFNKKTHFHKQRIV